LEISSNWSGLRKTSQLEIEGNVARPGVGRKSFSTKKEKEEKRLERKTPPELRAKNGKFHRRFLGRQDRWGGNFSVQILDLKMQNRKRRKELAPPGKSKEGN